MPGTRNLVFGMPGIMLMANLRMNFSASDFLLLKVSCGVSSPDLIEDTFLWSSCDWMDCNSASACFEMSVIIVIYLPISI